MGGGLVATNDVNRAANTVRYHGTRHGERELTSKKVPWALLGRVNCTRGAMTCGVNNEDAVSTRGTPSPISSYTPHCHPQQQ